MRGDYAAGPLGLRIVTAVAEAAGALVGTATVNFSAAAPEVAVVGDVLTAAAWRGRGVAQRLTSLVALGLGRVVALCYCSSTLYQIH